jgi:hypothetical protein
MVALLAIALGFAGLFLHFRTTSAPDHGAGLVLEGDRPSFGDVGVGEEVMVTARLRNTLTRPVRLLGSDGICRKNACIEVINLPKMIPAGSVGEIGILVKTRDVGAFSGSVDVFTDLAGQIKLLIEVSGRIHPSRPNS